MGTILKTTSDRSNLASALSPVRKSNMPFIIQLAGVSPGCTRALITTHRLDMFLRDPTLLLVVVLGPLLPLPPPLSPLLPPTPPRELRPPAVVETPPLLPAIPAVNPSVPGFTNGVFAVGGGASAAFTSVAASVIAAAPVVADDVPAVGMVLPALPLPCPFCCCCCWLCLVASATTAGEALHAVLEGAERRWSSSVPSLAVIGICWKSVTVRRSHSFPPSVWQRTVWCKYLDDDDDGCERGVMYLGSTCVMFESSVRCYCAVNFRRVHLQRRVLVLSGRTPNSSYVGAFDLLRWCFRAVCILSGTDTTSHPWFVKEDLKILLRILISALL